MNNSTTKVRCILPVSATALASACLMILQKSRVFLQKSTRFPPKTPTFAQKSPIFPQRALHFCVGDEYYR